MHKFKDLKVWNEAVELAVMIYRITGEFPAVERYGLTDQMKRSAVSIPSNIAEGSGRNSPKEFIHFLGISSGSASELYTQVEIATRADLMNREFCDDTQNRLTYIQKMNYRLQESISKTIKK